MEIVRYDDAQPIKFLEKESEECSNGISIKLTSVFPIDQSVRYGDNEKFSTITQNAINYKKHGCKLIANAPSRCVNLH